jgi:PAS domain S-box
MVITDLTEQKNAELELNKHREHVEEMMKTRTNELRRSEDRLRIALEAADLGTWDMDLATGIAVHSLRNDQIFGYQELQPEWTFEIAARHVLPEDRTIIQEAHARAEETGELSFEARVRWPDGSIHWITPRGRVYYDSEGRAVRIIGVVADITERKQAEIRLKEVADKYSALFNTTSDGVSIHNLNGDILEVNDAYCRMSGYSRDELTHKPISKIEAVETPKEIANHIKKLIKIGGHDRFESRYRRKDGSVFDVDITALYLEKEGGRIAIFVRDISKRKQLENLLQMKSKEQQVILDSTQTMIFYKDKENHLLLVNKAFEDAMGLSKEQLEGKSIFNMYSKKQAEAFWRDDLEVIKSGKAKRGIIEPMETPQGTKIVQTDKIPYIDEQGNISGVIGFAIDITERKRIGDFSMALNHINEVIQSSLRTDEVLSNVLSESGKVLQCETAAISLRVGDRWRVSHVYGFPENVVGAEMFDTEEPHAILAAIEKRTIAINDTANDKRVNRDHMKKWDIRSVMVVPLMEGENVIGVIFFNHHKNVFNFQQSHIDFADKLAASLSLALQNIRLYQGLQEELKQRKQAEEEILSHMNELKAINEELARFNRAAVDRELRIIELKGQINELRAKAGEPARYPLDFEKEK